MKKILLFSVLLLTQIVYSQVTLDGNKLSKDGMKYKFSEYEKVFDNAESRAYFKKARTNKTVGNIFGFTGGLAIGGGLSDILFNNKTTVISYGSFTFERKTDHSVAWLVTGIGAGLVAIGIPFTLAANKNAKKAVLVENGDEVALRPFFQLEASGNGMALNYNF